MNWNGAKVFPASPKKPRAAEHHDRVTQSEAARQEGKDTLLPMCFSWFRANSFPLLVFQGYKRHNFRTIFDKRGIRTRQRTA
ncbi:hypothetical protein SAMN05444959_102375 [Paracoccus seriniphilus]|uniref:Uncharacterized protein n=1 Tax=Paracoccus seriniphilus TaxID=184748 RepID=A0A239PQ53_9RHOB|nr:hypothetical protein SAMN05444959_102375 [Paracoccus seriniphilus]